MIKLEKYIPLLKRYSERSMLEVFSSSNFKTFGSDASLSFFLKIRAKRSAFREESTPYINKLRINKLKGADLRSL